MKTTVDIPDHVLRDAMRNTRSKTKRTAILTALEEMNRRHAPRRKSSNFSDALGR